LLKEIDSSAGRPSGIHMSDDTLAPGKIPSALLAELLGTAKEAGPELLLPPRIGEDACVIDLPAGALVAATDPITLTGRGAGAHAVWINANDVAVTGARPRWFLACVLIPDGFRESDLRSLFDGMNAALEQVGATLVGGHTEVTSVVSQPVVVGQMLGLREDRHFVATSGMRAGDVVLQVGLAPVEGAAVLAESEDPRVLAVGPKLLERARNAVTHPGISVVDAALRATELGAHALHDPTEGGLSAGLHELAAASGLGLRVDRDALLWFEPGIALCAAVGADPLGTLASGTLLVSLPADRSRAVRDDLRSRGWPAAEIAQTEEGDAVRDTTGAPLLRYERDELSRVFAATGSEKPHPGSGPST
jgi:hydrogenase expression/formation protein HypE